MVNFMNFVVIVSAIMTWFLMQHRAYRNELPLAVQAIVEAVSYVLEIVCIFILIRLISIA